MSQVQELSSAEWLKWPLLWLAGLYLRLTLLVAPAVGPMLADDLGLSVAGMGALTTLPVLLLSIAAVAGAWIIARLGPRRTVAACLVVIVLGSVARAMVVEPVGLYLATGVMGLGIAALQPALPGLVRLWTPGRVALATAVYMNGMLMGEVLSAGLTLPVIMPLVADSWRLALWVWSLPGLLVALAVATVFRSRDRTSRDTGRHSKAAWKPDFRDSTPWAAGIVLGASSSVFFGINAYMAPVLEARSESGQLALGLLAFNTAQVVASLVAMKFAAQWLGRLGPQLSCIGIVLLGTVVFGWGAGYPAMVAGFAVSTAAGILLVLMVSTPAALASVENTAPLAAGMFTVGYALSFVVPQTGGLLVDLTGKPVLAMVPLIGLTLLAVPAGWRLATIFSRRAG